MIEETSKVKRVNYIEESFTVGEKGRYIHVHMITISTFQTLLSLHGHIYNYIYIYYPEFFAKSPTRKQGIRYS